MQIVAIILSAVLVGLLAVLVPMEFEAEKAENNLDMDTDEHDEQQLVTYKDGVQLSNVLGKTKHLKGEVNREKRIPRKISPKALNQRQVI